MDGEENAGLELTGGLGGLNPPSFGLDPPSSGLDPPLFCFCNVFDYRKYERPP